MNILRIYGAIMLIFGVTLFIATLCMTHLPLWYSTLVSAVCGLLSREGYDWLRGRNYYES